MITTFKTGVMPVLEYGVGLWGVGCVRKIDEWKGVQDYWMSIARYILHAPVRSQFAPVWGDLNWLPFSIRAGYQAAQYWTRVSNLDDSCLVRKAMCVQRDLVNNGRPCWLANLKTMLLSTKDTHIKKLWNEWIANDELSRFNTRIVRLKRLRFDIVPMQLNALNALPMQAGTAGGPREEMVGLDRLVEEALIREAKDEWERELDRKMTKRGEGGIYVLRNKLRTYVRFN